MAQEHRSPWSRWDTPGFQYVPHIIQPVNNRQYDAPSYQLSDSGGQSLEGASLVDQRPSDADPNYLDCIYGFQQTGQQVVEQCYVDLGCCDNGCCENASWQAKFTAALALIIIFAIVVLIVFCIWMCVWLMNRGRDKAQRAEYEQQSNVSPTQSQLNVNNGYGY
ncbi:unnamed protein product [Bursaphelenchus okinawaensis]|uniref:CX domain-containing protein n=1 Tax=Bursaphelenchus okinawaensis TaxID=465554 RepID=A0A811KP54_9BILA|nr:unnamed protein product [Bursaphelenchus okinawaensis]CAG9107105.1 unnamed protein product [Bursaphelenchus okinawaensis]